MTRDEASQLASGVPVSHIKKKDGGLTSESCMSCLIYLFCPFTLFFNTIGFKNLRKVV